ncbi:hypothetical protein BDZ45DRAFT_749702 [Acephala macrosclerotiorum]|nr:hypothetical protein BDZ45DRAFT_749702 [Acephala macrosclerotiorum]
MLLPHMLSDLVSTTIAGSTRLSTSNNRTMVTLKMEVNSVLVAPEIRTAFKGHGRQICEFDPRCNPASHDLHSSQRPPTWNFTSVFIAIDVILASRPRYIINAVNPRLPQRPFSSDDLPPSKITSFAESVQLPNETSITNQDIDSMACISLALNSPLIESEGEQGLSFRRIDAHTIDILDKTELLTFPPTPPSSIESAGFHATISGEWQ